MEVDLTILFPIKALETMMDYYRTNKLRDWYFGKGLQFDGCFLHRFLSRGYRDSRKLIVDVVDVEIELEHEVQKQVPIFTTHVRPSRYNDGHVFYSLLCSSPTAT
jgi:hypothetical protein